MSRPVPLTPEAHGKLRVRPGINTARLEGQQLLPVVVHEFHLAGSDTPILFVKNSETGQFETVALLGLSQQENLMIDGGRWQGNYVPGVIRSDPFRLISTSADDENVVLGIDPESPLLGEEGEALFDDKGEITDFLKGRRDALVSYIEHGNITRAFTARLVELDLLAHRELTLDLDGKKSTVSGMYLVDEEKLNKLDDETLLELQKRGFLRAIYAHFMSLNRIHGLARLKIAGDRGEG